MSYFFFIINEDTMSWSMYYENLFKQLAIMFLPSLLKAATYSIIFKRSGGGKLFVIFFLTAFIPGIVLMGIPFVPIPAIVNYFIAIILMIMMLNRYTGENIFPKGLLIIVAVESISLALQNLIV